MMNQGIPQGDIQNSDIVQGITCNVGNCYYNQNKHCMAKEVKVGPQYAASTADTVCATFRPQ